MQKIRAFQTLPVDFLRQWQKLAGGVDWAKAPWWDEAFDAIPANDVKVIKPLADFYKKNGHRVDEDFLAECYTVAEAYTVEGEEDESDTKRYRSRSAKAMDEAAEKMKSPTTIELLNWAKDAHSSEDLLVHADIQLAYWDAVKHMTPEDLVGKGSTVLAAITAIEAEVSKANAKEKALAAREARKQK